MENLLKDKTDVLKRFYDSLNRNDISGMVQILDPEIVRVEPNDLPEAGIFRGLTAVTEHIRNARATWAEGTCEPERFIEKGDRIIAIVKVRVKLKHEEQWREGQATDVFNFRDDKVIKFRTFFEESKAFEWLAVQL